MGETAVKLESLSGKERQASVAGSYPGFRVAGQALVEDVPCWDGLRGEGGTIRGFDSVRESSAMFGFGKSVSRMNINGFKPMIPVLNGKEESFFRWKHESVIYSRPYGFDAVFAVVSSVQKRFEASAYKQLRRSKPKSAKDQAFAVNGGGKNYPGHGGSRHSSGKSGGSQGGRGSSGSGRGRRNGGSGGRGFSGGGASRGSSSASVAKLRGRTCLVCKRGQHYVRECPKQISQGCGERGHYITKCGKTEDAGMAIDCRVER